MLAGRDRLNEPNAFLTAECSTTAVRRSSGYCDRVQASPKSTSSKYVLVARSPDGHLELANLRINLGCPYVKSSSRTEARIYQRGRGPERYRGRSNRESMIALGLHPDSCKNPRIQQVHDQDSINDRSVRTYIALTAGGDATVGLALSFANFQVDAEGEWHIGTI